MMREPDWQSDDGAIQLYCGDSLDLLPTMEPGSVDAVVTDPIWPNAPEGMFDCLDPTKLFMDALLLLPDDVKRLAVHVGCNSDPRFFSTVPSRFAFFRICWLEYVRPGYLGRLLYTSDIGYFFGTPPKARKGNHVISGYCQLVDSARERFDHPCIRQIAHVAWIVEKWSDETDTILDPFMGSGTTGVACVRTRRRFVGCEIERRYFDIAVARIQRELAQPRLPFAEPVRHEQAEMFEGGAV